MMKKTIYSIIILAIVAIAFSSCDKNGNPVVPDPGNDGKHAEKWHYDAPIKGLDDIIPAIDEKDNIYFAGSEDGGTGGSVHFVSIDKDGNERWDKTLDKGTSAPYVIYADGKVFVATQEPVTLNAYDANNGSLLWMKNFTEDYDFTLYPAMAFANQKLYFLSGSTFDGVLMALNPYNGNELWVKNLYMLGGISLAVRQDQIFIYNTESVTRYDDKGSECDSLWSWNIPPTASRTIFDAYMAISDDGNLYIRESNIYIVSCETGQLVNSILLDATFDNSSSGISVDGEGNVFIGNGNLNKFSKDGNLVWKTDIKTGIISPNYSQEPAISNANTYYHGELFSLSCVKSDGTLDWALGAENKIGNMHPVTLNNDGDIIVYATEKGVLYCFKGDGHKLASKGWPKRYNNPGNTCSK